MLSPYAIFLLLTLVGPSSSASSQACSLEILVVDQETQAPLPEAQVVLRNESTGPPSNTQFTNHSGIAVFSNLSPAKPYYIKTQIPGHLMRTKTVTCAPGDTRATVELPKEWMISLIKLIASPKAWHERHVQVIGFLRIEFEGTALYLHKEDWKHGLSRNAVWVDIRDSSCPDWKKLRGGYVLLKGTFNAYENGHMGAYAGELHEIERCLAWR